MRTTFRSNVLSGLSALVVSAAAAAGTAPQYELVIIEPWDTNYSLASSSVTGLNNNNEVSGAGYRQVGAPQFLWTLETGKQEINFAGHINDQGVIAAPGAIRWPDGTIEQYSGAMGGVGELSNTNVVAGSTGGVHTCPKHPAAREAATWTKPGGTVRFDQDLGMFGSDQLWGINDNNEVVGVQATTGQCGDHKAFYYNMNSGQLIDLHTVVTGMSSGITHAYDINNQSVVVGDGPIQGLVQPFTWSQADGVTILPTLPNADPQYTQPVSINNHGVIVGQALDDTDGFDWLAVIWTDSTTVYDLNTLVVNAPADFTIVEAKRINDNGWIIGRGLYGVWSPERAVVLVPIEDEQPLLGDINSDDSVDLFDLLMLLDHWGTDQAGAAIAEPTDVVDLFDLLELLNNWG